MYCYPTTIGTSFLLWLFSVTSNEAKMLLLKMGLSSLGVYYVSVSSYKECYHITYRHGFFFSSFTHHNGKIFCILQLSIRRCMVCYPTTTGKYFLLWLFARSPPMSQDFSHLLDHKQNYSKYNSGLTIELFFEMT